MCGWATAMVVIRLNTDAIAALVMGWGLCTHPHVFASMFNGL